MGFGYFFFGVLMLVSVVVPTSYEYNVGIDIFPDIAGYILMLTAAKRLSLYAAGFRRMVYPLYALCLVSAVGYAAGIASLFGRYLEMLSHIVSWTQALSYPLCLCAFVFMFLGIYSLSTSVELPKIASKAKGGIFMSIVYFCVRILLFAAELIFEGFSQSVLISYAYYFLSLFWYVYIIFTAYVIFKCYMYICYEGEEQIMPSGATPRFLEKILSKVGKNDKKSPPSYHSYDDEDE